MRTSRTLWLAAAGLAATTAGVLAVSGAFPAAATTSSQERSHSRVLHLTTQTEQFSVIDVGTPGPALGLGDQLVSSDQVSRAGKPVGRSGAVVTVVGVKPDVLTTQWLGTLELPEGQLTLQGIGDGPTGPPTTPITFKLAVTGGTGAFADASGVAQVVDNPGGLEEYTIRLNN